MQVLADTEVTCYERQRGRNVDFCPVPASSLRCVSQRLMLPIGRITTPLLSASSRRRARHSFLVIFFCNGARIRSLRDRSSSTLRLPHLGSFIEDVPEYHQLHERKPEMVDFTSENDDFSVLVDRTPFEVSSYYPEEQTHSHLPILLALTEICSLPAFVSPILAYCAIHTSYRWPSLQNKSPLALSIPLAVWTAVMSMNFPLVVSIHRPSILFAGSSSSVPKEKGLMSKRYSLGDWPGDR